GMVADYKFEGNAQDNSHSFDGKLYGNIRFVKGVDGKGLAADFGNNFTDNWIEIKNSKSMGLDQGHTLSYWIKSNENNAQKTQVYFSHYLKETDNWVVSYLGRIPDEFRNRDDSNNTFGQKCISRFDGINSVADGKWHHVVWTAGDTWERGYVDGKLSYSFGCDYLTLKSSQTQFYIGLYGKTGQYPFTGAIDELKIYNRLLNETEITTLYEAHKTTANARLGIGSTTPRALTNPLPLHN
ncbi:MAG: LamG domain-containing protein, partial [Runella zeae]